MGLKPGDNEAYRTIVNVFRRERRGITVADLVAKTALSLETVRELVSLAADEFNGRLEVTESGEILYSFPHGFTSRYRGFRAGLRRAALKLKTILLAAASWLFKVWIMVMLVGYFLFFVFLALASLVLSVAVSNSNSRSRRDGGRGGGWHIGPGFFDLIIRFWFYSELFSPRRRSPRRSGGKPLYRAIFSFVFGDEDPNANWSARENQALIAYIRANRGVIALPEFMAVTGLPPDRAESEITARCVEFGGLPEVTEEGTLVYRFDQLLLGRAGGKNAVSAFSFKELRRFSANPPAMNRWFGIINGVNLGFGTYFLVQTLAASRSSYLFNFVYVLFNQVSANPLPLIGLALGAVPLAFSLFFWLIPAFRFAALKGDNEKIKLENFRKTAYRRIWDHPRETAAEDLDGPAPENRPQDLAAARDRIIKEMGAYSLPEVAVNDRGQMIYTFGELEREREALKKYRDGIDPAASELGKTVFDSGSPD
jgi:hypothetical protein